MFINYIYSFIFSFTFAITALCYQVVIFNISLSWITLTTKINMYNLISKYSLFKTSYNKQVFGNSGKNIKYINNGIYLIFYHMIPIIIKYNMNNDVYKEDNYISVFSFIIFSNYVEKFVDEINDNKLISKISFTNKMIVPENINPFPEKYIKPYKEIITLINNFNKEIIPFKSHLNFLFHGKTGTRKSSSVNLIAQATNSLIINIDLSYDKDKINTLSNQIGTTKKKYLNRNLIIVLDEIDKFMVNNQPLVDILYKFLDGPDTPQNVVIILISNNPEIIIDNKTLSRKGRIDYRIEFIEDKNEYNIINHD